LPTLHNEWLRWMQPVGRRAEAVASGGVGGSESGGAVARRTSLWTEIARDRELRRKQNERADRLQRQIGRQLESDARNAAGTRDREARAEAKALAEAERHAGQNETEDQNSHLTSRVDELTAILRSCLGEVPPTVDELTRVEAEPFDPKPDGVRYPQPVRPVSLSGGLLGRISTAAAVRIGHGAVCGRCRGARATGE
jgi:hypothetical protein